MFQISTDADFAPQREGDRNKKHLRNHLVRTLEGVTIEAYTCMMTQACKEENSEDLLAMLRPEVFKALADPNRQQILVRLAGGNSERTVTEVAGCCSVDLSVVSRHLANLRDAGIVRSQKRGKEVFYTLEAHSLVSRLRAIADAIERCCGGEGAYKDE